MQQQERYLLEYLCSALVSGQKAPDYPEEEHIPALLKLAGEQNVLPLVLDRLLPAARAAGVQAEALRPLRQTLLQSAAGQARRTQRLEQLCRALDRQGLNVLVVKGLACRVLYPNPDLRPSSDEDLLAPDEEWGRVHPLLEELGLRTGERKGLGTVQEVTYLDPVSGLRLEVHRRLFPDTSKVYGGMNRVFLDCFRRAVTLPGTGAPVWTMSPEDHLCYLICHSLKHFLHSGFGIRQVCDICLSAAAYGDGIDWQALFAKLEAFRADYFAVNLFEIGVRWLGFSGLWPARMEAALTLRSAPDCSALLEDLLAGGVYGGSTRERLHSSRITLNAATAGRGLRRSLLHTLFPAAEELKGAYPYLKEHPWMLPGAWAQRLAHYAAQSRPGDTRASLAIGERRVELLRKYRVIP